MERNISIRIAFADAMINTLWLNGLITKEQRDQMSKISDKKLREANC